MIGNRKHHFWIDWKAFALPMWIAWSPIGDFWFGILCFHYHFDSQGEVE